MNKQRVLDERSARARTRPLYSPREISCIGFRLLPLDIHPSDHAAIEATTERATGRLYLAKPYSAKSESAVQESAKPYSAKPYSAKPESAKPISGIC